MSTREQDVIHPFAVILINGIKCRALLGTGAGNFHIPSELSRLLGKKPLRTDYKQIETMLHTTPKHLEFCEVQVMKL